KQAERRIGCFLACEAILRGQRPVYVGYKTIEMRDDEIQNAGDVGEDFLTRWDVSFVNDIVPHFDCFVPDVFWSLTSQDSFACKKTSDSALCLFGCRGDQRQSMILCCLVGLE